MAFQYPANPQDGTVLIQPQEDGTFLKGTYDINSNTWEIGVMPQYPGIPGPVGPEGPPGEQGEDGRGVEIKGIVPTENDLPNESKHAYEFWMVDDTNTLYISDGTQWINLGSPIQGPQGESMTAVTAITDGNEYKVQFSGTIEALNLTTPNLKGANGAPGTGWYATAIVDDADGYRIRFLSNTPDLEFTTDDLRGPEGTLTVASETNLGGIKIGRGLSIAPDGTLNAGQTDVDLGTTPVDPNGIVLSFAPIYVEFLCDNEITDGPTKTYPSYGFNSSVDWANTVPVDVPMPAEADAAMVWWQAGTIFDLSNTDEYSSYTNGQTLSFRCYLNHQLYPGGGAVVTSGPFTDRSNKDVTHNWSGVYYDTGSGGKSTVQDRKTARNFSKIEVLTFAKGTTLSPRIETDITEMSTGDVTLGGQRMIILPYKTTDTNDLTRVQSFMSAFAASTFEDPSDFPSTPLDETEIRTLNAADLKNRTAQAQEIIAALLLEETDPAKIADLETIRTTIAGVIDLPGTYADLDSVLSAEITKLNTGYLKKTYRFETAPPS